MRVRITAPTVGTYAGILLFQSRDNTRALAITGSGAAGLAGTIYAPAATLSLSGAATESLPLIVNQLNLSGSAASTETVADVGSVSNTLGQLQGGNLYVYVDKPRWRPDPRRAGPDRRRGLGLDAFLAPYSP